MKRAIETVLGIKTSAAFAFTGFVIVGMLLGYFTGWTSISFSMLWQLLFLSAVTAVLQSIVFNDIMFKKLRYALRVIVFAVPLYAAVAAFAWGFRWFPASGKSWLIFTAIFLGILLLLSVVFEVFFRITGTRLNNMLDAYKANDAKKQRPHTQA